MNHRELEERINDLDQIMSNNFSHFHRRLDETEKLINDKVAEVYRDMHMNTVNAQIDKLQDENRELKSKLKLSEAKK